VRKFRSLDRKISTKSTPNMSFGLLRRYRVDV